MARTIEEIKREIAYNFMHDSVLAQKYGYEQDADFSATFSAVSMESILIYIVAVAIWALESLLDEHKSDVDARIEEILPHRPKWYRDMALKFMLGYTLVEDADYYDTSDMTDDEIEDARVVKYAAATEDEATSLLTIKIAGTDGNGTLIPIDDVEAQPAFEAYIKEIKDAGVRVNIVNQAADQFQCKLKIFYDAMLSASEVESRVEIAVKQYIQGLPFNGEYTNMALVDRLQLLDGVKIAEVTESKARPQDGSSWKNINVRYTPDAGYMTIDEIEMDLEAYS